MRILGIDYGRSKIGLAISEGKLAEPLRVIRYLEFKDLARKLEFEIKKNNIEKIVVGVSEGDMALEIKKFVSELSTFYPQISIVLSDETLSTYDAQELSIISGMGRKKRKEKEDAYAATVMLQNYLDTK